MSLKKIFALAAVAGFCLMPVFESTAAEDGALDESVFEEPKPAKKKKTKGKEIESNASVEAPAPEIAPQLSPDSLRQLNEIMAAIQLEEANLRLSTIRNKILETQIKGEEMLLGPEKKLTEETQATVPPLARVFPMPGGNPQVIRVLGGNAMGYEATLKFPNGALFDVVKGMTLENGYMVSSVSARGVIIEKNGLQMTMPVSTGGKAAPWSAEGEEQGVPVPPPPSSPETFQPLTARQN